MPEPYGRIYRVYSKECPQVYVGATTQCLTKRLTQLRSTKRGPLREAFDAYGVEGFRIEELDTALSNAELRQKEREWVRRLDTFWPNGLNLHAGGCGGNRNSGRAKGFRHSEETKRKISAAARGRQLARESKLKIFQGNPPA